MFPDTGKFALVKATVVGFVKIPELILKFGIVAASCATTKYCMVSPEIGATLNLL